MAKARLTDEEKRIKKNEYERKYNAKNKDRIREQRRTRYALQRAEFPEALTQYKKAEKLKQRYGITLEQHEKLFEVQGRKCAICLTPDPGVKTSWQTDHCHTTGSVRGILCQPCNTMLGKAQDNTATLARAISYLGSPPWASIQ